MNKTAQPSSRENESGLFDRPLVSFFPTDNPRKEQLDALEFIQRAIDRGYNHIVIQAPTGSGKSLIGVTVGYWASSLGMMTNDFKEVTEPLSFYLVTQKLLQDQLESDILKHSLPRSTSIKSSVEYQCKSAPNCHFGGMRKGGCSSRKEGTCPYTRKKAAFAVSDIGITNYAYLFSERTYAGQLASRNVVICDECHTLESQLLQFAEMVISTKLFETLGLPLKEVPDARNLEEFTEWLKDTYEPIVIARLEAAQGSSLMDQEETEYARMVYILDQHLKKVQAAVINLANNPENWVFWGETSETDGEMLCAKPIHTGPWASLLKEAGSIFVYLSAYPGTKDVFCRTLGLDRDEVAWKTIDSTFPAKNRPIFSCNIGSLSRKNLDYNLPSVLKSIQKIVDFHHETKGVIHCTTYKLGEQIFKSLRQGDNALRAIFPRNADERNEAFRRHAESRQPTILVSPSMTEGYDFHDDLARWQIIVKVPYPYLGDRRVEARQMEDPDWYDMQAVSALIQSSGRAVRSVEDSAITYILDSDFERLYDRQKVMFPKWWRDALQPS